MTIQISLMSFDIHGHERYVIRRSDRTTKQLASTRRTKLEVADKRISVRLRAIVGAPPAKIKVEVDPSSIIAEVRQPACSLCTRVYIPRPLLYSRLQSYNPTTQTQASPPCFPVDYQIDPRVRSHVQRILQPRRRRQGRPGQDALHQPRAFRVASLEDLAGHDVLVSLASNIFCGRNEKESS